MACSISRMQFLRGDFAGRSTPIRPPWAIPEKEFVDTCTACGECVRVCPTKILKTGRGRIPQVDFSRGGCTLCGDCARVCEPKALRFTAKPDRQPWRLKAHLEDHCLTRKGVVCQTCGEACEFGAISFRLALGGVAKPEVNFAACNGCGECYAPCPVNAVTMRSVAA
jgi:ferredoxin-type protein NapF